MSEVLTIEQLQSCEGDIFLVYADTEGVESIPMQLASVTALGSNASAGREPFSLLFVQPEQIHLPQGIYSFDHSVLGALDIFIVPLGPGDQGMRYEAIFS